MDSLDPAARRVLQLGSVFGRSFTTDGVASVEGERHDHASAIEELVDRELLRPAGRGELTFRHIIIRDVAYGTLTRAERCILHAAAGRWLESRAADREDELAELVAFHYREAAVLSTSVDDADPQIRTSAVRWLRRAADVASGARGVTEAAGHLRAAIELAEPADQAMLYERLGRTLGSGDASVQAHSRAWQIGREHGLAADFLLEALARHLMVLLRYSASVGQQPSEREVDELIALGNGWVPAAGQYARAMFLVALGFKSFWLRQAAAREVSEADVEEALNNVRGGLALAEKIDDAPLISAALDGMAGITQADDWPNAVRLAKRRMGLADRIGLEERLDALQVLAWGSIQLGELDEALAAADAAMAQLQPGQNMTFAVAGASWSAYGRALQGDWTLTAASVDDLRRRWMDAGRPAAAYALQGILSGVDWARNRGDEASFDRWQPVALEIITSYPRTHPVAAIGALLALDMDAIADVLGNHNRYPDRAHYVEHATALCADRGHPVPVPSLDDVIKRAERASLRVLEAQARRLRGMQTQNPDDLTAALRAFDAMGARRYAARSRVELGLLTGDKTLLATGNRQMAELGEGDLLPP